MLTNRFLTGSLPLLTAPSRRDVLRGLAAGLGLATAYPSLAEAGKKKRKRKSRRKKKKAKSGTPNAFGCLEVGQRCKTADQCCSGLCTGKKGNRRCEAHGTGSCNQGGPGFCDVGGVALCNGSHTCICTRTTAGSFFCGNSAPPSACAACTKDADCVAQGFPAGSACVPWSVGGCKDLCDTGMACLAPC